MKILFIGDIVGTPGRRVLSSRLRLLRDQHACDVCIANVENAAGGFGATISIARKLHHYGVDIMTGGNHSFATHDAQLALQTCPRMLRPLNYPAGNPGVGMLLHRLEDGRAVGIVNLRGSVFANERLDCPFQAAIRAIDELSSKTATVIIDFHAEATSEKRALFHYLNGRVSALVGTHTHVQTADNVISAKGTAYITDVGMTGAEDSCIGLKPEKVLQRFLLQTAVRFELSNDCPMINAVAIEIDDASGKASSIERIYERLSPS